MIFLSFPPNSTIYTDLAVIQPVQWSFWPFVSHLLAEDPGPSIPRVVAILPYVDGFLPILSKLSYLYRCNRHLTLKCQNSPFVSHLLAENQGPLIRSVVAILPDFDGFLQISLKLDYFYRFSRNRRPTLSVLTVCLPPARWGPRAVDSQCRCNIAWFRWISYFAKTRPFIQI